MSWLTDLSRDEGYVKLFTGAMFSGKSNALIADIVSAKEAGHAVQLYRHKSDNRYGSDSQVTSHDGLTHPAKCIYSLEEIRDEISRFKVIGIDEAHFFPEIGQFARDVAENGKILLTTGVHSNNQYEMIPAMASLLAVADEILVLRTNCENCTSKTPFTRRVAPSPKSNRPALWVGGSDTYKVLCRKCIIAVEYYRQEPKTLKIRRLNPDARLPVYASPGAAGMDLTAIEEKTVLAGKCEVLDTGLSIVFPANHYGRLASRSGLVKNNNVHVAAGILDEDFRGSIKLVLMNLSSEPFTAEKGMRLAQLIIEKKCPTKIVETTASPPPTKRGKSGFGSTGLAPISVKIE